MNTSVKMDNKTPKYAIGDIIQHKEDPTVKRTILWIFTAFYDETGISSEIYYQTRMVNDDNIPPTAMKESAIDMYYTKTPVHQ
jgi:hypothetical protein